MALKFTRASRAGAAILAAVVLGGAIAPQPARAGWSPAMQVAAAGEGATPALAFGPGGNVAITSSDGAGAAYLLRRPAHGAFSAPVPISSPAGPLEESPRQVVLPAGGATVLLTGGAPWYALVQPKGAAGSGAFETPQEIAPPDEPESLPTNATMLATAKGDVIAVVDGDSVTVGGYTMILPRDAERFRPRGPGPGDGYPTQFAPATDGAGGAFLAWPGNCGGGPCVSYRAAGGRFSPLRGLTRPPGCRFQCIDSVGIGAGGDGYVALGEVYGLNRRLGPPGGRVALQLGRRARLGRAHVLATTQFLANTSLVGVTPQGSTLRPSGPVVDGRGNVTVAWQTCGAQQLGCSLAAASGDVRGNLGLSRTLATTPRVAGTWVTGLVGDGDVAIQRCGPGARCSISVAFAGPGHRFGKPQQVTSDGKELQLLVGDARGNQVLVWKRSDGREYAASRRAGSRRFSSPHALSAPGSTVADLTGAFGPRGEAIVTWVEPNAHGLFAATFGP